MDKTVVGLFETYDDARQAVAALVEAGVDRESISVMRRKDAAGVDTARDVGLDGVEEKVDPATGAVIGGASGAVLGAAAGAVLAGLAGIAIPGLGLLLGVGPLAATIMGGAGIGAVSGGVAGALVNAGVSHEDAEFYARGVHGGGTLVSVHAIDAEARRAADILARYRPVEVDRESRRAMGVIYDRPGQLDPLAMPLPPTPEVLHAMRR